MKYRLLFALPLAAFVLSSCGPDEHIAEAKSPEEVAAPTSTVEIRDLPTTHAAIGTLRPKLESTLSAKIMSRVEAVHVREGDRVRAGQLLVTLDARDLDASVAVAGAQVNAAKVGIDQAQTAARMEASASVARIAQAEAALESARAAVGVAESRLELALAGPRPQERVQADLAVQQAESNLRRAEADWQRAKRLVDAGALAAKSEESARNAFEVARAQHQTALESRKISQEGTRQEEVRTAREGLAQARAGVKVAEANVKEAKAAALQVDLRREQIKSARAQTAQSQAGLQMAAVSRSYAAITAPFDGIVVSRTADPGSVAAPGIPLLTVHDTSMRFDATVPESILGRVNLGDTFVVEVPALNQKIPGKVVEIVPRGDSQSHTFSVKLELPKNPSLRSSMFARAQVPTGTKRAVLAPRSAVWQREGLTYTYVVNSAGIARLRIVTLGADYDGMIEVLSGLSPGELVVTERTPKLEDGVKVVSR